MKLRKTYISTKADRHPGERFVIDIHSHILPGLDDGCATMDESIQSARILQQQGISTLIATPHYLPGHYETTPDIIRSAVRELDKRFRTEGIRLNLLPGCEIMIHQGITERILAGELMTVGDGGTYALVEFPPYEIPWYAISVLEHMVESGITPILAHPERYTMLHRDLDEPRTWYFKGILAQLDIASLFGLHGSDVQRYAELMIRNHLIHLLGSDLHGPISRVNLWKEVQKKIMKMGGEDYFRRISIDLPAAVLEGGDIRTIVPQPRYVKSFSLRRLAHAFLGNTIPE